MGDQRDYAPRPGGVFYNQGTSDSQGYGPPPGSPPYLTPEAIRGQQMQHLKAKGSMLHILQRADAEIVGRLEDFLVQEQREFQEEERARLVRADT